MTSAQKKIVRTWIIGSAWVAAFAMVFQLPQEYRLKAGLALGFLFSLWPLLSPEIRNWRGYGAEQQSLGEFISRHGLLQLWLVGYCTSILPFLIYRIGTSELDNSGVVSYFLCFILLVGPPLLVSELERFQAAG